MHKIFVRDLIEKCNCTLLQGNLETELLDFSKDTRTIKKDEIYIGIKGELFEGSTLYEEALDKGACGCILNDTITLDKDILEKYKDRFIVVCKDTIKAIQELASYKRSLYDIPVIGITGSVGKTSTKDIITSIMNQKYNTLATIGNYNSHIGLPLTILRLKDENAMVLEMGMNNLGEISTLSKIAKPTVAVITNVGTAHIGNLGSRENILKAKLEILDGMDKKGILVINNDNDLLHKYYLENQKNNVITFGILNDSNYMASNIISNPLSSTFNCNVDGLDSLFTINIPGNHFVLNALCAISIGKIFNLDVEKIKNGILNFSLTQNRMQVEVVNGITLINDCYNANLDSMTSAINYLGTLKGRTIAVLGDMLELGTYSEKLHREIAKHLLRNKIDIVITVGHESMYIIQELNDKIEHYSFLNNNDANDKLKDIIKNGDNILIKASNGMHFNEIYEYLKNNI